MLMTLCIMVLLSFSWSGKQRIIVRLREPLKAETVKIRLPELTNSKGERRDLETQLELGDKSQVKTAKTQEQTLKLNMVLRSIGKSAIQVTITLPQPGYAEVLLLDFYGKNLATLMEGQFLPGTYYLKPFTPKEGDHNGIQFLALRINGKIAMKRVLTKVK
jgi:hypothetical protein